jgi:hypothetical protein
VDKVKLFRFLNCLFFSLGHGGGHVFGNGKNELFNEQIQEVGVFKVNPTKATSLLSLGDIIMLRPQPTSLQDPFYF